jgi:hypothetical protein
VDNRNVKDVLAKYSGMIENKIQSEREYSADYLKFKDELSRELTQYEKFCKSLGGIVKLKFLRTIEKKYKRLKWCASGFRAVASCSASFFAFLVFFYLGYLVPCLFFYIS